MIRARRLCVVVLGEPTAAPLDAVLAGLARRGHEALVVRARDREPAPTVQPHDARVVVAGSPADLGPVRPDAPPTLVVVPEALLGAALRAGAAAVLLADADEGGVARALDALLAPVERRALLEGADAARAALLDALPVGLLLVEDGRIRAASAALTKRLGHDQAGLEGRPVGSLLHRDDAAEVERRVGEGAPWTGVARLVDVAGGPLEARVTVAPCGATPGAARWIVADLASTEALASRERAEYLALSAERNELVFLGTLVQSVVHDLRNPLQAALFGLSTLRAMQAGKAAEPLTMLERKVREIEAILAELHECAQPWRPVLLPFPLGELLEGARFALADAARERQVELRVELPLAGAPEVQVDPPRLKQALINLGRIAVEASVPGAAVVLRAGVGDDGRGWLEVLDDRQAPPGGADFTAGAGRGSRRRLAIARRTIEGHGGVLEVGLREPRGGRVRVELPASCTVPV